MISNASGRCMDKYQPGETVVEPKVARKSFVLASTEPSCCKRKEKSKHLTINCHLAEKDTGPGAQFFTQPELTVDNIPSLEGQGLDTRKTEWLERRKDKGGDLRRIELNRRGRGGDYKGEGAEERGKAC